MLRSSRAFALVGVAGIAACAIAGCGATSSSQKSTLTIPGRTLAIVISAPRGYRSDPVQSDIVDGAQLAFDHEKGSVTKFKLIDQTWDSDPLSDNARLAITDQNVVTYIGELQPGASDQTVGITNALDVLQVSPTDTALELGQATPAVPGGVESLFQQWKSFGRSFARVVPTSAQEAQAQIRELKSLNVSSLFIASDGSYYGQALADAMRSDAHSLGVTLTHDASTAGAVFYAGISPSAAAAFYNKTAGANPNAKLFGTSVLDNSAFLRALSATAAKNLLVTTPGFMPKDLPAAGKSFETEFKQKYGHVPSGQAIFGYEAMSAVIHNLATLGSRANNRADVVHGFLHSSFSDSALGSYSIRSDGNTTLDAFVWNKDMDGTLVPFRAAS